jgi:hypothetical protein
METPIHKITMYTVELGDHFGIEDLKSQIENTVEDMIIWGEAKTKDAGEFTDDHVLNHPMTAEQISEYFTKLE